MGRFQTSGCNQNRDKVHSRLNGHKTAQVSRESWVTRSRGTLQGPKPKPRADPGRLKPPWRPKDESGKRKRHSPHQAQLSGPSAPDLETPARPLLGLTASKRPIPKLESRHHCPIIPCAGSSIRLKFTIESSQETRVPGRQSEQREHAFKAAVSSTGPQVVLRPIVLSLIVDSPPLACRREREDRTRSAIFTKGGNDITSVGRCQVGEN